MDEKFHVPRGAATEGPFALVVTPERAGWTYSGLRVVDLPPGGAHVVQTGDEEMILLPLAGGASVACDGQRYDLVGRESVFSRVSDFVYLPRDTEATISSTGGGRFALPAARCERRLAPRYRPAEDVPVELRGAGACSRQVTNFCAAD